MTVRDTHWLTALAAGAACAALAGCSPSAPQEEAPPPPAQQAPPPPLAGGPPAKHMQAPQPTVVTMAPIPNPGDLSPQERRRIYGPGHHHAWRIQHGHVLAHTAGPVHAALPAPVVAAAPVAKPVAAPAAPVVNPPSKLVQLQNAVGPVVAQGSNLAVSPDIAQGKPGGVALTLPPNLLDMLRAEAEKFGFKRAARHADVAATLSGDGYAVTPPGPQTQALKSGQAAHFAWQVTPGQSATGPLRAEVSASLKGQGAPKLLSLATLQSAVAQAGAQAQSAATGLHLPSLSDFLARLLGQKPATAPAAPEAAPAPAPAASTPAPAPADANGLQSPLHDRTLPIVGHVTVRAQIAAFLAFLAVLILLLIQRNMAEQRRSAERRRFRTMNTAYQPMDMDSEPSVSHATSMSHEPEVTHEPEVSQEPEPSHEPEASHEHSTEHEPEPVH